MKRVILLSDFRTLSDLFSEVSRQAAVELPAPFLLSTHFNGPGLLCREEEPAEPQPSHQHTPSLFMFLQILKGCAHVSNIPGFCLKRFIIAQQA